jgi:hypothetical protein
MNKEKYEMQCKHKPKSFIEIVVHGNSEYKRCGAEITVSTTDGIDKMLADTT